MPELFQFGIQLNQLLLLLAAATGLEHPTIDDLDLFHRVQLLRHVLEELACEEDKLARVWGVHWQGGREDVEPHAVDNLSHVARPISLIHGFDFVLGQHLFVHTPLIFLSIHVQLARLVE